jgi:hypothetical protein
MTAPATPQITDLAANHGLTVEELEQARQLLRQAHNAVIGVTKCLTGAQWQFKPAPGRWSIAENLDHLVSVQERVGGALLDQLPNAPATPQDFDRKAVDSIVIHQFSTRMGRFTAPEFVRPASQIAPQDLLVRLAASHAVLLARLESTPGLRDHVLPAPPLKAISKGAYEVMDGYQWILAASGHTERHVLQILEVMGDPAYPV